MKRLKSYTPILLFPVLAILLSGVNVASSGEVAAPDRNSTIDSRAEYWKAHAFVNLSYMKYKISLITNFKNNSK